MSDDQDVKRWLRAALADEPPLRLDRDEVFRSGRRKLRHRKLFQAGGAVTGVVAVVVGAVVVTGLVPTDEPALPPAASSTTEQPPTSKTTEPLPTTTTTEPWPSSSTHAPPDELALRLMAVLNEPGLLPVEFEPLPGADDEPMFREVRKEVYEFEADMRSGDARGWLSVLVEHPSSDKGGKPTCSVPDVPFDSCDVRFEHGMEMTVAVQKRDDGEIRHWVRSTRPDGTFVTAISSNLSEHDRAKSLRPPTDEPLVTKKNLITLAAHPDLSLS